MAKVFISYSRKDIEFAKRLTTELKKSDLDFWIDWEGIPPTVDWWKEIEKGIEEADIFLFLISPDSASSKVCGREIDHADKNGKRLIPLLIRDVKADNAPQKLSPLNWLFFRETDDFKVALDKLRIAIHTDYEWVKYHTKLQVKALEWERQKDSKDTSRLIRGKELQEAEQQLANAGNQKDPQPTILQRQYLLKSRQYADYMRRTITWSAVGVAVIMILLSLFAWGQRNTAQTAQVDAENQKSTAIANEQARATAQVNAETNQKLAQERARIARAGELAAQTQLMIDKNFENSILLGIESFREQDTVRSRSALLDVTNANPQLLRFLTDHTNNVTSIAFSPNGKTFATGSDDHTVILRDMKSGQLIGKPFTGHTDQVTCVAFSPDGKVLASGGIDNSLILWDIETRQTMGQKLKMKNRILSLAFSPDGKTLSMGSDYSITLWDIESDQPTGKTFKTDFHVTNVAFTQDGKALKAYGESSAFEYNAIIWDLTTRQPISPPLYFNNTNSIAINPDNKIIASGNWKDPITLWDVATGQTLGQFNLIKSVEKIAFSPDGKILASGNFDGSIILWDITSRLPIGQPLKSHTSWITNLAFSPDNKTLVSSSADNTIILWDITAHQSTGSLITSRVSHVNSVAFSPDGKVLASGNCVDKAPYYGCNLGGILLWNVETHQSIGQPLNIHSSNVASVAFNPDGKILASSSDKDIILWDMTTLQPIGRPLSGHSEAVLSVAFSPDGKILASSGYDRTIILWDVATRSPIGQPLTGHSHWVNDVVFSPNGKILASSSADNTIILWDVSTQQQIGQPLTGHTDNVTSVSFSPNGEILASSSWDKTIIIWDVDSHKPIGQPLIGHTNWVNSVVFNPDGKSLVSGSEDYTIILWDVSNRQAIGQPITGNYEVNGIAFNPNGNNLAAGYNNGNIIFWDLDPQLWIKLSCNRVGRNFTLAEWGRYFPNEEYRKTCEQWPSEPEVISTTKP